MPALSAVLLAAGVACSDHRINIDEFVALQETVTLQQKEAPPPEGASPQAVDAAFAPHRLSDGDLLTVTLTGLNAPTEQTIVTARVHTDGQVTLPLVGGVAVGGRTIEEAEKAINDKYVPSIVKSLAVNVQVAAFETTDVLVVGAALTPGLVQLRRSERDLAHAVALAGGFSPLASGQVIIRRVRKPTEETTYNLLDPNSLQAALAAAPLDDGDIVNIQASQPNTIYVGGLVNIPAPQPYPSGTTPNVLQALAAAGGLRTDVFPSEGLLIRRMPDGRDVQVKLDLTRLAQGKDPNIMLASGDILWVPETAGTRAIDWVNRNIYLRAGASVNYNVTGIEFLNRRSLQGGNQGGGGGGLQDAFDPFGFLNQNAALGSLLGR